MGFCKICTGRKKPGMNIKIVVNLKKDTVCRQCDKHFEVKTHRRKRDKKLVIFISRLSYSVRPSRHGGARRLLLPICREPNGKPKEAGWLDMEIDGGDVMGSIRYLSGAKFDLPMGQFVPSGRLHGILEVA